MRKCPYCDFYSVPFSDGLADQYTDAVLRAIAAQPYAPVRADTLYFGGGTPALLGHKRLGRMVDAARSAFGVDPDTAEITLEANPSAVSRGDLSALRACGFNRLSFGVQSLQDGELRSLGRAHSAGQACRAIDDAHEAGFDNLSADLMLAIPGQTRASLADTIERLAALPLTHISAYLLKLEEGTTMAAQAQDGALSLPDEDAEAELYLDCVRQLELHGFAQYEISNFARGGKVSRHNRNYWRCGPYLGIGPAAHSFWAGRRFSFSRDLQAFLAADAPFSLVRDEGAGGDGEEVAMLRLRLSEGLAPGEVFSPGRANAVLEKARQLAAHGLVHVRGERISLTPQGFLLSNSVIAALLAATDPAYPAAGG